VRSKIWNSGNIFFPVELFEKRKSFFRFYFSRMNRKWGKNENNRLIFKKINKIEVSVLKISTWKKKFQTFGAV
jgi:hypothetical protein